MEDNEWESIHPSSSASQSDEDDCGAVVLTRPVPTNHEGLPVSPQPPLDVEEPPQETETPSTTDVLENESPEVTNTLLSASLGILSSWILRIGYGIRSRTGFMSVAASVASFVTLTAYARRRWQRRRRLPEKDDKDRLLILLNQKDEKIKQLLLQIDRLKETLSARRRVPVFRVVVDSPLVIGPRLN